MFVGVPPSGYFSLLKEHGIKDSDISQISTSTFSSVVAGRIAYNFALQVCWFYKLFIYLQQFVRALPLILTLVVHRPWLPFTLLAKV